ncbi:MAG TPA: ATP-binding protein, partial [Solirubrobacteraceae bacterium]|nr:ATP-binding protein [Solirubrobacteraceae bacterium]
MAIGPYRLDELGWLQFERLCAMVLAEEAGVREVTWLGRADRGRVAMVDTDVVLERAGIRLRGPLALAVVWVRPSLTQAERLTALMAGVWSVPSELGFWFERVLVLTNLETSEAQAALTQRFGSEREFAVFGAGELGDSLDRRPALRAAMPSVLGLRDLEPLIAAEAGRRSTVDVSGAQELARVFWPTRAYERARDVLRRHRFVVLTGPPEMGKTAIARMMALAQLTDGWEAHECTSPDQVWRAFDRERRQVFVADDAFGSTEYRADAAELWARELGRMLGVLDDRHWLIWTSRPAPLKAGLRRVQRERGSEHFPAPGEVLVDASELDLAEKTLILFRHAKAHDADEVARNVVRSAGVSIVEHSHFTPERIRRLVADRLDELVRAGGPSLLAVVEDELARPTDAMRNSFRALEDEHRELLIALLDAPAGLIDERELAATVRRHHSGGLRRPPGELIDRLTDHFLRVTPLGIGWVHPSWRDLVID